MFNNDIEKLIEKLMISSWSVFFFFYFNFEYLKIYQCERIKINN